MSYVKIWIHVTWSTKNRFPFLEKSIRKSVFEHIYRNAHDKGILIEAVNGHKDHVHCLFRLKNDQTISKVIQLIKGESSYWINKEKLTAYQFKWQKEYYAASICESSLGQVKSYIANQEEHHKNQTFMQKYEKFIEDYDVRSN